MDLLRHGVMIPLHVTGDGVMIPLEDTVVKYNISLKMCSRFADYWRLSPIGVPGLPFLLGDGSVATWGCGCIAPGRAARNQLARKTMSLYDPF